MNLTEFFEWSGQKTEHISESGTCEHGMLSIPRRYPLSDSSFVKTSNLLRCLLLSMVVAELSMQSTIDRRIIMTTPSACRRSILVKSQSAHFKLDAGKRSVRRLCGADCARKIHVYRY